MNVVTALIEAHIIRKINNRIEFLLLKRSPQEKYPKLWQMVTGAIENEEKASDAAIREIQEETGIELDSFWVVPKVNSFYSEQLNKIVMIPVFVGLAKEGCEVVLSEEHTESKWVNRSAAKELLAWPGQKESIDIIEEYFSDPKSPLYLNKIF